MSITPESVQKLLDSDDYGDRLRGVNQLRQLQKDTAFKMVQPLLEDQNARVRYSAVSQFDTLGTQDLQTSLELLRDRLLHDSEADVQAAAADALGALKIPEAFEDLAKLYHSTSEWLIQFS
ncbi:MAG: HEAT repeat domain-containing protein, partial [Spirulinaceae cyanobacterium]